MARVLFTSTQGVGHFRPLRPFMASAIRMGHDVAVVVPPALAEMAHKDGVRVHVGSDPPGDELDAVWRQVHRASHAAAEQLVLGEIFGRLKTAALLPTAREVVTTWRPDIVIHETAEFSGVLAAEQAHVPHATIGISHAHRHGGRRRSDPRAVDARGRRADFGRAPRPGSPTSITQGAGITLRL